MAIKIDSIRIQKLGPLSSIQLDLGMLNLIYGSNESGKTYLTEFLLHSIFRHANTWNLREVNPEGSVHLHGLRDKATVFSPSSLRKIEDYWQENESGLPLNMARLLVVKGGELNLSNRNLGGVDREVLKNALTSQALLDQIRDSIQPTVRKAKIIDQKISGKNQGQINDLNILQNKLRDIESLLVLIDKKYSGGPARYIEDQIDSIQHQLNKLHEAKRHKAYLLSKQRKDIQAQREKISNNSYLSLRDRVRDHRKLKSDLQNISTRIKSSKADVETYHWLKSAIATWEENELENKRLPDKILIIIGGLLLTAGLVITFLQYFLASPGYFWAGAATTAIGAVILVYFGIQLLTGTKDPVDAGERNAIKMAYLDKFGQSLKGITGLRAELNILQEKYLKAKSDQEEYGKLEVRLASEQGFIKDAFLEMFGYPIPEKDWESSLEIIKDQSAELDIEISDLAVKLAVFNIAEDDFLWEPPDIEYDPQIEADLEHQVAALSDEVAAHQGHLETLKARAAEWTRDDITTPWTDILHHLRLMRNEIRQSYLELSAEITAKIGLSEILSRIEEDEDQKIIENINSEEVINLLKRITGRYQGLNLLGDQVHVRDPYQEYALHDLSTGAREQIQLALRLGIASHVSGGEPLFIILDDAFQHSDWERRESLVDATVQLVSHGWQAIYLTMDNHLRDLFIIKGKAALAKKFTYFEL